MSRILVVDDHSVVRTGIRKLLAEIPDAAISDVASGEEALKLCGTTAFDLVILDLNLPGVGGLELVKRLLRGNPRLQILVFSLHTEAIYATRAIETGARGFVSKNAPAEELLSAVRTVLAGGVAIEKDIAKEIADHGVIADAYLRPLTQRDLEIVRLLVSGKSLAQIADTLGVAYKTVANTLSMIKEKLGVDSTADLIRLAISRGLTDLA